jgi:hypothetical protein
MAVDLRPFADERHSADRDRDGRWSTKCLRRNGNTRGHAEQHVADDVVALDGRRDERHPSNFVPMRVVGQRRERKGGHQKDSKAEGDRGIMLKSDHACIIRRTISPSDPSNALHNSP